MVEMLLNELGKFPVDGMLVEYASCSNGIEYRDLPLSMDSLVSRFADGLDFDFMTGVATLENETELVLFKMDRDRVTIQTCTLNDYARLIMEGCKSWQ